MRKLIVIFLSGAICLLGVVSALAYNEAPMLRTMVAAGELPPVEERLPEEPIVVEPFEEIGQYGGTAHVFAINPNAWNDLQPGISNWGGLFETSKDGKVIEPNIAKGYEWSEDLKTFTIYLRKGLKWSDGVPFTADDIVFQFEDIYGNDELTPIKPSGWSPGGELLKARKVDDYTVRLEFSIPYPLMEAKLQTYESWQTHAYSPKHYLKKWHIKYNPKADELAKEEGYDHWWEAFKLHAQNFPQQEDLNLPRMLPWIMKRKTTDTILFERNPYYWKVDSAGNQLPYIDRILSMIVDTEVYQLKAISGEADYAFHALSLSNYPLYTENEEKGDYRVILHPFPDESKLALGFNFNEKDPILRKIYHNIKFRQALSLAINRDEINELIYFGKAVPCNVAPCPSNSYYKKEWAEYYAQYDPETANRLLDEMGLKRGKDGFRLRPDGKRLELTIEYFEIFPEYTPILELVKEYWEAVGVKVALKQMERSLFSQRSDSSDHGIMVWERGRGNEILAYVMPMVDFCHGGELSFFHDWISWAGPNPKGEQSQRPEDVVTYKDVMAHYNRILKWQTTRMGSKEYMEQAEKIFDYFCKQLWCIGTVGYAPRPMIVKNSLRNVPDPTKDISGVSGIRIQDYAEQWFFKQ